MLSAKQAMNSMGFYATQICARWGFNFSYYQGHRAEICEVWDPTLNRYCGGGYLSDFDAANTRVTDIFFAKLMGWLADAILCRYELNHGEDNAV